MQLPNTLEFHKFSQFYKYNLRLWPMPYIEFMLVLCVYG